MLSARCSPSAPMPCCSFSLAASTTVAIVGSDQARGCACVCARPTWIVRRKHWRYPGRCVAHARDGAGAYCCTTAGGANASFVCNKTLIIEVAWQQYDQDIEGFISSSHSPLAKPCSRYYMPAIVLLWWNRIAQQQHRRSVLRRITHTKLRAPANFALKLQHVFGLATPGTKEQSREHAVTRAQSAPTHLASCV